MEKNIVLKNPMRVSARIAYVYPSLYRVMISSLSPDIIYYMLNKRLEVYVERFHCTSLHGLEQEPRSLETKSRLRDFPLILTTLHYEPDIVNLVRLLIAGGIEVYSRNRAESIVIAGGPVALSNPIPYSDVIDAFIIGEAESTLDRVVDLWLEYGDSKKRFLEELSQLKFTYVPGYSDVSSSIEKSHVEDLNSAFYPVKQVENTTVEPIYGRGFKVEVSRGCPFWCSFCMESRLFQPFRERSLNKLKEVIEEGLKYTISGKRLVLYSLSFPTTSNQYKLLEYLSSEGFTATMPSLRIGRYLEKSLELIKNLGQRTLTLAPESFTHTLQSCFFKYTSLVEYIEQVIREAVDLGFDLKLYLVYGVKGVGIEKLREDIEYITRLVKYAKERGRKITLSLNPLIPKPHTMFQWIGMSYREELLRQLEFYRRELKGLVEARIYDIDWGIVQAQLALSPKPLGRFIYTWALHGGGLSGWRRAIRETSLDYSYVFTGYDPSEKTPWSFINLGWGVEKVNISQFNASRRILGFN
jgi:radical SAM superfamily enzyme YgiQ (UPF0313 family)